MEHVLDAKQKLFINGQWIDGHGDEFCSTNPATENIVWKGKSAASEDVMQAIDSAEHALEFWQKTSFSEREKIALEFARLLQEYELSLATAISEEVGKPLWESKTEVLAMRQKISISIEAYKDRCKQIEHTSPTAISIARHKPHGVVAVFGPFNFPGHLPNGHIVPSLLAGNTVVFKPSELSPKTADIIVQLWQKAGLPDGVLQLLQGAKSTGHELVQSAKVSGIYFTGSEAVGKQILQASTVFPFRILALEMGGNNPLVVSSVSSLRAAVFAIVQSAFLTTGQRCTSARRLIISENDKTEKLLALLQETMKTLHIGKFDSTPEPFMGPVVTLQAKQKILSSFEQLQKLGGKTLVPCRSIYEKGAYLLPGLIDMTGCDQFDVEIFGPVLQVFRVQSLRDAIHLSNQTSYGLSASILTDDKDEYDAFWHSVRAGVINWNMPTTGASSALPFGGVGKSGNFRPSAYYAADYCAYPVASQEMPHLAMPEKLPPGIQIAEAHAERI